MRVFLRAGAVAVLLMAACGEHFDAGPLGPESQASAPAPAPPPLTTIPIGTGTARIWSYITDDISTPQDPVNLVFTGKADPRAIRNALLGLDGNRGAAFPPVFPFTCTWSDAIGGLMAGYAESSGWAGDAVQLQCGLYGPIRFHLRLFKMGSFTVGNAHFEAVIPGTTDHQVLSWELAEQLVTFDMVRTGLLAGAPASTGPINAPGFYRFIPVPIYNGLPAGLRALIGGPLGDVSSDVGIATDGQGTVFALAREAPPAAANTHQEFVIDFNQVIPKPFCSAGPLDYVYVQGPVTLDQDVTTLPTGELRQVFRASGDLSVVPIDITTGLPAGEPMTAKVSEDQESRAGAAGGSVGGTQLQQLLPASNAGAGQLMIKLNVTPGKWPRFDRTVICH